jgi:hypothetical protein
MKKGILLTLICSLLVAYNSNAQITKRVLVEKYTSAGCGNCPDGTAKLTTITASEPNVIWISHHAGWINDAMGFAQIDSIASAFTQGAPTATFDRVKFAGNSNVAVGVNNFQNSVTAQLSEAAIVDVNLEGNYDAASRTANITVRTNFETATAAQGAYHVNVIVVEDDVVGMGSGYNQSNYFNNTSGHAFQGLGNPISGYAHRNVARAVISTAWGTSGIIPNTPMANTDYVANYTYQIPAGYDETKVRFVAFITDFDASDVGKREVLNANERDVLTLDMATNTAEVDFLSELSVFPNPANTYTTLQVETEIAQDIQVSMMDLTGKILWNSNESLTSGQHNITIPTRELSNGLYLISIQKGNQVVTRKLAIKR